MSKRFRINMSMSMTQANYIRVWAKRSGFRSASALCSAIMGFIIEKRESYKPEARTLQQEINDIFAQLSEAERISDLPPVNTRKYAKK